VAAIALIPGGHRVPPPFGLARTGLLAFDGGGDLYLANADGTGLHALTSGPAYDFGPTFSLDGTRIAYWTGVSCRSGSPCVGPFSIQVVDVDGSHAFPVDQGIGDMVDPTITWSPDGGRLAYVKKVDGTSRVIVVDLRRGTSIAIGDANLDATAPQWSPRGDLVAFDGSHRGNGFGVYVAPVAGGPAQRVSEPQGGVDIGSAQWSPDGSTLLFFSENVGPHDIYSVRADGGGLRNLTNSLDDEFYPVWSNAGTKIAYERLASGQPVPQPQVNEVWVMDADGGNKRELPTHDVTGAPTTWSPDDRDLLAYDAQLTDVFVIAVDGSHPQIAIPAAGLNYADGSFQRLAQ
jgi:TolB protein